MLLDGKILAQKIEEELKSEISAFVDRPPCLAVLLVGEDPASQVYVGTKKRACERVGIRSLAHQLSSDTSEGDLLHLIEQLNRDPSVDGILCQLPLPPQISERAIIQAIDPDKDVDGFHPINSGKLLGGDETAFVPCTPLGVKVLLERYEINVAGMHVVIIGRSNIVGKPLAALLMQNAPGANATVTVLHSRSRNLKELCRQADVIILAMGRPLYLNRDMVKKGAIVIDVGINRIDDPRKKKGYRLVGDADFENLRDHCSAITPVPGGVGPMTVAILLKNTLISYKKRHVPARGPSVP